MKQTKILTISKRGITAPASPIRKLIPYALDAKKRGIRVYHLNIGDPDFPVPGEIKKEILNLGHSINRLPYPQFRGQHNLLQSWKKYYADIKIPYLLNDEDILVTAGASDALSLITAVLTDPGDEILVFEPFFPPIPHIREFHKHQTHTGPTRYQQRLPSPIPARNHQKNNSQYQSHTLHQSQQPDRYSLQ